MFYFSFVVFCLITLALFVISIVKEINKKPNNPDIIPFIVWRIVGYLFIGCFFLAILNLVEPYYYNCHTEKLKSVEAKRISLEPLNQIKTDKYVAVNENAFYFRNRKGHDLEKVHFSNRVKFSQHINYKIVNDNKNFVSLLRDVAKDDSKLIGGYINETYVFHINEEKGISKDFKLLQGSEAFYIEGIEIYDK